MTGGERTVGLTHEAPSPWVSEQALCGLMVLVAAALRLGDLAGEPLGAVEAASAWPAWAVATGHLEYPLPLGEPQMSPLLFGAQWALFWVGGGGGEALARAWPAVLGTVLVLVPWLMRPAIGREATLTLVGLLTVDPVLVRASRTADGAVISAFCALVVVACLVRWRADVTGRAEGERGRQRWLQAAAVSLGCLVASGRLAWSLLLLLGVAALWASIEGWARAASERGARESPSSGPAVRVLGAASAATVLAATAGLTRWQGLQGVSASLTAWLAQWPGEPGLPAVVNLLGRLLLEQPLALGLGALGLATEWRRPSLALWRRRMTLLAVCGLAAAMGRLPQTLLLILAAAGTPQAVPAWRAAIHRERSNWLLTAAVAGLFLLTLRHAVPHRSGGEAATEGARLLASDVASLCAWEGVDVHECPVQAMADPWADPLLAWHLRDLGRLRWVLSPRPEVGDQRPRPLIITPADSAGSPTNTGSASGLEGYAASHYRLSPAGTGRDSVALWVPRDPGGAGGAPSAPLVDRLPRSQGRPW